MKLENIKIVENTLNPNEYLELRKSLKWISYSYSDVEFALSNSLYVISIYYNDKIIGMGRIVGDKRLCFYIQDIMIKPNYQHHGVGTLIMQNIMSYLNHNAAKGAYIGLMSKKGKEQFYEKFGFIKRPNDSCGNGMIIRDFMPY